MNPVPSEPAHGADTAEFAINIRLIRTDIADDLAQFGDAISGVGRLELFGVNDESLGCELDQLVRRRNVAPCLEETR